MTEPVVYSLLAICGYIIYKAISVSFIFILFCISHIIIIMVEEEKGT